MLLGSGLVSQKRSGRGGNYSQPSNIGNILSRIRKPDEAWIGSTSGQKTHSGGRGGGRAPLRCAWKGVVLPLLGVAEGDAGLD